MTKVVDVLDMEPERQGLRYVRYADDFSIYTKSKSKAKEVGNRVYVFLRERLKLPINKAKSGIRRPVNFELLGHGFVPIYKKGIKGQYQLVVSKSSWNTFKRNLKGLTKKTKPMSLIERLDRITQVCRGWVNNYRLTNSYTKLKKLDEWLRNRLWYCIWHDWRAKRKFLAS